MNKSRAFFNSYQNQITDKVIQMRREEGKWSAHPWQRTRTARGCEALDDVQQLMYNNVC